MSQFVILAQTPVIHILSTDDPYHAIYALTTSNDPVIGLAILNNYSPLPMQLIHSIHAGNRTDLLKQTLEIKFRPQLLHNIWYNFASEHLAFLRSLNESNFAQMIGFIQKGLAPPEMTKEQMQADNARLLEKAASLL